MGLFRTKLALASIAEGDKSNATFNGTATAVKPNEQDAVKDSEQEFAAAFHLVVEGGTDPTVNAKLQTSWDGATWFDVNGSAMTEITAAATVGEVKQITGVVGPWVRAVIVPGGTAAPTVYGTVDLVTSGRLR